MIPLIEIEIGTLYQKFSLSLDINCQTTWLTSINELKTSTFQTALIETEFRMDFYSIEGLESEDNIKIDQITINNFPFIIPLSSINPDHISGVIGLSRLISPKNSIIHHAFNQGLISKRRFRIETSSLAGKIGKLFFGDFSGYYSYSTNHYHFYHCPVKVKKDDWNCNLNYIIIGKINMDHHLTKNSKGFYGYQIDLDSTNHYYSDTPVYFSSIDNYLFVPNTFIEWLRNNFFKEQIESKNCKEISIEKDMKGFECNSTGISNLNKINFVFESFALMIHPRWRLFTEDKGTDKFIFIIVHKGQYEKWLFGLMFIKNEIMFFDYDSDEVIFYSSFEIEYANIYNSNKKIKNDNDNEESNSNTLVDTLPLDKIIATLLLLLLMTIVLIGINLIIITIIIHTNKSKKITLTT